VVAKEGARMPTLSTNAPKVDAIGEGRGGLVPQGLSKGRKYLVNIMFIMRQNNT
jgi:hypothetical protein